jgi:hypothetical protein
MTHRNVHTTESRSQTYPLRPLIDLNQKLLSAPLPSFAMDNVNQPILPAATSPSEMSTVAFNALKFPAVPKNTLPKLSIYSQPAQTQPLENNQKPKLVTLLPG